MQPEEVLALGDLVGGALGEIAGYVHRVHAGIAARVWQGLGPAATPVRLVHDAIASGAYGMVDLSLNVAVRSGARVLSLTVAPAPLGMTLRHGGRDLDPTHEALADELPHATGRLAVFVHGFCETDAAWLLGQAPYGVRLEAELGYTPLYVRYNSGLPVADSGRGLATLLQRLTSAWPTDVDRIVLIGHGMGGAVATSACREGTGAAWESRVAEVLTLGSPPRGVAIPAGRRHRHHAIDYRRFASFRQLDLLDDPGIYEQIRKLLAPPGLALPAAPPQRP